MHIWETFQSGRTPREQMTIREFYWHGRYTVETKEDIGIENKDLMNKACYVWVNKCGYV